MLTILAVEAMRNLLYFESITLLDRRSNDCAGEGKSRSEVGERGHDGRLVAVYRRSERLASGCWLTTGSKTAADEETRHGEGTWLYTKLCREHASRWKYCNDAHAARTPLVAFTAAWCKRGAEIGRQSK